jgi:uncharacterized protein (DUF58 family)
MRLGATLHELFVTWAMRVHTPEAVPVVLTRHRVYVLPTRAGLGYTVALLVMLLGAINYNLSLGYVLTFLLGGLGVVTILHTFRNLAGMSIQPGRASSVYAGETVVFHLLLRVNSPRRQIRLWLQDGDSISTDPDEGAACEAALRLPSAHRGWLALPRVGIETFYPLGLVRAWAYCAPEFRCLVYPRPATKAPPLPWAAGDAGGQRPGSRGNDDFAGLRDHQPADPPRHVAWKTAAHQGPDLPLLTKQFSGATAARVWLDWDALPVGMAVEERLSVLTRWALDTDADGLFWGLRLPGRTLAPASGHEHLQAVLTALALHGQS